MRDFACRWLILTVAVLVVPVLISGIRYDSVGALVGAGLPLGILNAFVRPVLLIVSAPLILVTLGFFILVINAVMLFWVPGMVTGFQMDGLEGSFWRAIVIGLISWALSAFRESVGSVPALTHHPQLKHVKGRVIARVEGRRK